MNNKPLKKVCTKCLDSNKQLQLNADFFVEVQYGICDCCGNRGIVIPFERFFNTNTKLTPYTAEEKTIQSRVDRLEAIILNPVQSEANPETTNSKQPQPQKQPKNAKVDGDAVYE
jgi:hypothetical protein